jgi:hypothetical protein
MKTLVVYVPETHLQDVKNALFGAGAGRYERYDHCAWEVAGTGQFRPLEGSNPHIGRQGTVEQVREFRVEMICTDERVAEVIAAMRAAHPYEEPAFAIFNNEAIPGS